ncbi:hypothetical protein AgCh_000466 [Apium graveolens]
MAAMSNSREIDPLLKDLSERKQSFRQNAVLLAAELKEVRSCLASQEQSFVRENITCQAIFCEIIMVQVINLSNW